MSPTGLHELSQVGDLTAEDLLHTANDRSLLTEPDRELRILNEIAAVDACLVAFAVMLGRLHDRDRATSDSVGKQTTPAKG